MTHRFYSANRQRFARRCALIFASVTVIVPQKETNMESDSAFWTNVIAILVFLYFVFGFNGGI